MSDREIDRQLVERAQRGDKQAFALLVEKYQRKLGRLLSRFIRDPAEVEDVTQEAFIKAYRALPAFRGDSAFYTWLYRIGINTAKNYLMALGRRAPTSTEVEAEDAEGFEEGEQQPSQLALVLLDQQRESLLVATLRPLHQLPVDLALRHRAALSGRSRAARVPHPRACNAYVPQTHAL